MLLERLAGGEARGREKESRKEAMLNFALERVFSEEAKELDHQCIPIPLFAVAFVRATRPTAAPTNEKDAPTTQANETEVTLSTRLETGADLHLIELPLFSSPTRRLRRVFGPVVSLLERMMKKRREKDN